jgi:peptidoglycan/xylan/chitin deacetylase (PgdA/CDA1 family)
MRLATLGMWLMAVSLVMLLVGTDAATATQAKVVRQGQAESRAVALTFDDGSNRAACARIARTLRAFDATGTFFVNGNYLKIEPSRWRKILRGQVVGNHTRSHRDLTTETDVVVRKQLLQNERLHESILGRPMLKVLRPPYGAHDRRVRRLAGELGYRYTVLWSVDTFDWKRTATVDSVIRRATRARPGSIILMHCSRSVTPAALPAIIRHYRGRGIELAGLDDVLGLKEASPVAR